MTATAPQPALAGSFPTGFRFGAATAAYQIEGAAREDGRGESIWDRFCTIPGSVANGDNGDVACDHYHRWAEDLELLSALRMESYRFSIAWPRVQPDGRGPLNHKGVSFYRRLVENLLERGIEPVATLYHWDLPQARQLAGGWAVRETAERFAEYAAAMADALGDLVAGWVTHNEPWVVAFLGHAHGVKAPGVRDWQTALTVSHNLLVSHGLAVDALRAGSDAPVGITLNLTPMRPVSPRDVAAAVRLDGYQNRWFLDPVLRGAYPEDMVEHYERRFGPLGFGELEVVSRPIDFLGVNYYNPTAVRSNRRIAPLGAEMVTARPPTTAMGWTVDADGLHEVLTRLRRDYGDLVIYITENGAAFDDEVARNGTIEDPSRVSYLADHIEAVRRAIADGVDIRRYYAWSLLDNFEWEHGYDKRFGIVGVDFDTQVRTVKRSGLWYRDYIAAVRGFDEMAQITFDDVSKVFPDGTRAVDGLDLEIGDGEFTILVGPSGSGKSTALRMVAGLEDATGGAISIGSRVVNDVAPKDRDIAMVFQSYALYPHMSVDDNMGFALKMQRVEKDSIRGRVGKAAARLGIRELLERRPKALSGGQRQRVALGRAIVRSPEAFLMDEPLSNLDAKLRVEMRAYIARLHQELGTTTLYVTHDQTEAMTMGDRVAVMRDGRLEQVDTPERLYGNPSNVFVAGFIGSPAMNLLRGRVGSDGWLELGSQRLRLPRRTTHVGDVVVGIRPEAVAPVGELGDDVLELRVMLSEMLGSDVLLHLHSEAQSVLTGDMLDVGGELDVTGEDRFIARVPPDVRPAPGTVVRLRIDMARVHLFDPVSERVILR